MLKIRWDGRHTATAIATALVFCSGCMFMDESQWTTVSGSVRSQYGNHPALTNLKEDGTFMGGKTYSVAVTIDNCTVDSAYARLYAHVRKAENDPAWKDLFRITGSHVGEDEGTIEGFQKSSPSSTSRGTRCQYEMRRAGSGVVLSITITMSPGLFARTDDVIRDFAETIDAVSAGQVQVAATPSTGLPPPPSTTLAALPPGSAALDIDTELEKMIGKFAGALRGSKIAKVAVLDVLDLHGNKSELGRSLEEKLQITLVEQKIKVIDRNNIDAILNEQKMSRAGLCNPEDAKKFGQISGTDALILGTITLRDDKFFLTLKAISTETADVVAGEKCVFSNSAELEKMSDTVVK